MALNGFTPAQQSTQMPHGMENILNMEPAEEQTNGGIVKTRKSARNQAIQGQYHGKTRAASRNKEEPQPEQDPFHTYMSPALNIDDKPASTAYEPDPAAWSVMARKPLPSGPRFNTDGPNYGDKPPMSPPHRAPFSPLTGLPLHFANRQGVSRTDHMLKKGDNHGIMQYSRARDTRATPVPAGTTVGKEKTMWVSDEDDDYIPEDHEFEFDEDDDDYSE